MIVDCEFTVFFCNSQIYFLHIPFAVPFIIL